MIDFDLSIRRVCLAPSDGYSAYEKTLQEKLQALKDTWEIRVALINEELIKKMQAALEDEIKYCQFHREYLDRVANESGFDEWIFIENIKEQRWTTGSYRDYFHDEWVFTNGRIKATIRITPPETEGKMTCIKLSYENDSHILSFIDRYVNPYKPHHLKNAESIKQRIEELKADANRYLDLHLYPRWSLEVRNLEGLNKILCITSLHLLDQLKREAEDQNTVFDDISTLDPDTRRRVGERLGKIIKEELDRPEKAKD